MQTAPWFLGWEIPRSVSHKEQIKTWTVIWGNSVISLAACSTRCVSDTARQLPETRDCSKGYKRVCPLNKTGSSRSDRMGKRRQRIRYIIPKMQEKKRKERSDKITRILIASNRCDAYKHIRYHFIPEVNMRGNLYQLIVQQSRLKNLFIIID